MKKNSTVKGFELDSEFRCGHYHKEVDVVAIQFNCCGEFYACYKCHDELADHEIEVWPKAKFEAKAIQCGGCKSLISIAEYLKSIECPHCKHVFNIQCRAHHNIYFEE